jgi:hypothetical protein
MKGLSLSGGCMSKIGLIAKLIEGCRHYFNLSENYREYQWTQTKTYQRRLAVVKYFWIVGGGLMLISGHIAFILGGSLFLSFVSFAYLEE